MKYLKQLREEINAPYFKAVLLEKLHSFGIPESAINLRIASEKTSEKKQNVLGFYRQNSQFISESPYMSISIENTYRALLEYSHISEDDGYDQVKNSVISHMLDTACHEYGHVIEEYLHFVSSRNPYDKEIQQTFQYFKDNFIDNEDFAEQFGLLIAKNDIYSDEVALKVIYDFYSKAIFPEYSFEWIKLPKDEKNMDFLIDTTKSFEKWNEITDEMAGQSLDVCKDIVKILKAKYTDLKEIEIVRLVEPKNFDKFPLKDIQFEQYSHNVVKVTTDNGVKYLDFLNEHTGVKKYQTEDEVLLNWGKIQSLETKMKKRKTLTA